MKKTSFSISAMAIAFSSTMAFGAITTDQLISEYQTNGYSYIEVKSGLSQIKVEAVKDGNRIEVIYDIATGAPIKTSTYSVGTIVTPDPGVRLRNTNRDFSRSDRSSSRDDDSDDSDDYETHSRLSDANSRDRDDNSSSGRSRDDDHNDDHGDDHNDDHGDDHDIDD